MSVLGTLAVVTAMAVAILLVVVGVISLFVWSHEYDNNVKGSRGRAFRESWMTVVTAVIGVWGLFYGIFLVIWIIHATGVIFGNGLGGLL
jgi:hypothetical protein